MEAGHSTWGETEDKEDSHHKSGGKLVVVVVVKNESKVV